MTAVVWFRRDLRVRDHPALRAALAEADRVVPAFCFDHALLAGRHASGPRTQFLIECLRDLDAALRERGSRLLVRRGSPARELAALAAEAGADSVHVTEDAGPYARRRDERVRRRLAGAGVRLVSHPGLNAVDRVGEVRTGPARPTRCSRPFTGAGSRSSAGRCSGSRAGCPSSRRRWRRAGFRHRARSASSRR